MPQTQTMTLHEKLVLSNKAIELEEQGKFEEAKILRRQIPIPPYLAKFVKEHFEFFGEDFFTKNGYNLSEADAKYGPGWLDK